MVCGREWFYKGPQSQSLSLWPQRALSSIAITAPHWLAILYILYHALSLCSLTL